ncbi:MAG TPA: 4Fe-4S binding protein [Planctomycetota bacterium]|jgi:tetratricopeptide (TPR) repeat protein/polyferredoxin|nr:4Fe-4S binding protein [Planctomycetota bacterium]
MSTSPGIESGTVKPVLAGHSYTKKRAASLLLVYVLVLAHIIHWRLAGKTLAPLEFNEVRLTLEVGIVTAGFLFMVVAFTSTAIFGRFFCSWGCHILALEDGCAWLLDKVGLRPKPIRSKLLALIPIGLVAYLFLWPVAHRLALALWPGAGSWLGTPPEFAVRVTSETEGWGSFVTNDLWRNLPGPWIAGLTFLVCGFAVVFLVGSRSFCRYACPYGAVFAFADKFAKGRIVSSGGCVGCGKCTESCRSDVQVIKEITKFGKVVDPSCLKCLDCVSACPSDALAYGFTTSAHQSGHAQASLQKERDFSRKEEGVLVALFALALGVFVGLPEGVAPWAGALYGKLSLFLSVTLAVITALVALHLWRVARGGAPIFASADASARGAGFASMSIASLWLLFVAHSGLVQYHTFQGSQVTEELKDLRVAGLVQDASVLDRLNSETRAALDEGERHLQRALDLGLFDDERLHRQRAWLALTKGDVHGAEAHLRTAIALEPRFARPHYQLGRLLAARGEAEEASEHLALAARLNPEGRGFDRSFQQAATELLAAGLSPEALALLTEGANKRPDDADVALHLGRLLLGQPGRARDAIFHLERAAAVITGDPGVRSDLAEAYLSCGEEDLAEAQLRLNLSHPEARAGSLYQLGRLREEQGRAEEATEFFRQAHAADPSFPAPGD